ncbi:MAG: nitroreductase family protein [Bacteroidales bacterium]|nr:nitroreductase family protein [Bacteroidales bacterium]
MEYYDLIRTRESIRNYDPGIQVAPEKLNRILEAGRIALSAANRQPWEFWLISSVPMLQKIRECYHRDWYKSAPHILVVVGKKDEAWVRSTDGYNSVETDTAIAMTHIILAAENEGVGACWIAAFDPGKLRHALNLREDQVVFGITPLGHPMSDFRKKGEKVRKDFKDVVRFL